MRLVFNIPTWNRPNELEVCVQSIASQVRDARTSIIICQDLDGEENETTKVIQRLQSEYAFIKHVIHKPRTDYAANFRASWMASEGDWTWTFGDDDILRKGALDFALEKIEYIHKKDGAVFLHVAEAKRTGNTNGVYTGSLLNLCKQFGWIEMTGFITGNIVATQPLLKATKLPNHRQRLYARTAFWQSCALLEVFCNEQAALLDIPLIDSQNREQTQQTLDNWKEGNIGERYYYLADALEMMFDDGVIKEKLPKEFFRYIEYHLWNRFLTGFVSEHISTGAIFHDRLWASLCKLPMFLEDEALAAELSTDINYARQMTQLSAYLQQQASAVQEELQGLLGKYGKFEYPYHFGSAPQGEVPAIA